MNTPLHDSKAREFCLRFAREQWFALPISIRQRWWAETDYGMKEPSEELMAEIEAAVTK